MCFVFEVFLVVLFTCLTITDDGMDMGMIDELWYVVGNNIFNRCITAASYNAAMNTVP